MDREHVTNEQCQALKPDSTVAFDPLELVGNPIEPLCKTNIELVAALALKEACQCFVDDPAHHNWRTSSDFIEMLAELSIETKHSLNSVGSLHFSPPSKARHGFDVLGGSLVDPVCDEGWGERSRIQQISWGKFVFVFPEAEGIGRFRR